MLMSLITSLTVDAVTIALALQSMEEASDWTLADEALDFDRREALDGALVDRVLDLDEGRSVAETSDGALVDALLDLDIEEERKPSEKRSPRFEGMSTGGCDIGGINGGSVGAILELVILLLTSDF